MLPVEVEVEGEGEGEGEGEETPVANLSSFNFHLASCRVNDVVDNTQELVSRRTS